MTTTARSKLDAPSRRRLAQLVDAGEPAPERFALLLRSSAPFSAEQLEQLKEDGATIRMCTGSIATIDVSLQTIDRVLQREFVLAAQISSPLYPESKRGLP